MFLRKPDNTDEKLPPKKAVNRFAFRAMVYFLAVSTATFGVPLPKLPDFIPQELKTALENTIGVVPAQAFQIKRVIRGSTTMSTTEENKTVDISGSLGGTNLNLDRSILLISESTAASRGTIAYVMGLIDGPASLLFVRLTSGTTATLDYMVVEFKSGVTVTQAVTVFSESLTQKDITLPAAVTTNKSFPILTNWTRLGANGSGDDEYNKFTADLIDSGGSSQTLRIARGQTTTSANAELSYQVVTFDKDVTVQKGTDTMAINSLTSAIALGTAVDPAKSLIFLTSSAGSSVNGAEGYYAITGTLTGGPPATTLTLTRGYQNNSANTSPTTVWYVVTFSNETFTQSGTQTINAGTLTANKAITSIDLDRTFGAIYTLGGTSTTATYQDDIYVRGQLSSATNLALNREGSTVASTTSYTLGEFPMVNVTSPNGAEVWKVGEVRNITWEYADDLLTGGTFGGSGPHHKVDLLLSEDGGSNYNLTIVSGIDGTLGTYAWTVPPAISTSKLIQSDLRVRVKDIESGLGTRVFDSSDANFEIKGTLTITNPQANVDLVVGSSYNIAWNTRGDFNGQSLTGTLYYSKTGSGGAWISINGSVTLGTDAGSGSSNTYSWTVPDALGTNNYVKIERNGDTSGTFDIGDSSFNIKRSLTVTQPNGGQTWQTLANNDILWDYRGQTGWGTVKLEYTLDQLTWNSMATGQPVTGGTGDTPPNNGKGKYVWTVPNTAVTSELLVRVTSESDTSVTDTSNAVSTIIPTVQVDLPNGGETLYSGNTYTINWTAAPSVANVKVEYSTDGGSSWVSPAISNSTGAHNVDSTHGSINWTVPTAVGTNLKVRVADVLNLATVNDVSNAAFTIKGKITNVAPSGGSIAYNTSQSITWVQTGSVGNVKLKLSSDGGSNYATTLNTDYATVAVSGATQAWTWVMGTGASVQPGTNYKVRVIALDGSNNEVGDVYGDSASTFKISGVVTVTSPTAGTEVWPVGSTQAITWTRSPATLGPFKVSYSTDGGASFTLPNGDVIISSVAGTTQNWTIPAAALSQTARIKVETVDQTNPASDTSDNNFKVSGVLTIVTPNGNANPNLTDLWRVGTNQNISWTSTPTSQGNVELRYSTDGGSTFPVGNSITTVASNSSPYTWAVPAAAQDDDIRIRIQSVNDANVLDTSDYNFKVRGRLVITQPNGGLPALTVNQNDSVSNITWTTYGSVPNVNVYYSTDSGSGWTLYTSGGAITNVNAYAWTVPNAIGTQTRVRVEGLEDPTAVDDSDADFTVRGSIATSAPTVNEVIRVGGSKTIQWTNNGTLTGNTKLFYSTDDGTTFPDPANLITTVSAATTSYSWTNIPDAARSDTAKVKVIWQGDPSNVYAVSPQFKVKPDVNLTSPDSGTYQIGDALPINFTHTGRSSDIFNVLYSTDGGSTYPNPSQLIGTVSESGGATGSLSCSSTVSPVACTWTIPNVAGIVDNDIRIRVERVGDTSNVNDQSTSNLTFRGTVAVTYPNAAGIVWTVGDTSRTITWNSQGISNLRIDYTLDNGVDNYANVITTSASGGSYTWTPIPPAAVSSALKIRVKANDSSPQDNVTSDTSDNVFRVKPKLTLTYPTGGEVFVVGTTGPQAITWTNSGTIDYVEVYYTTDTTGDLDADGIPDPPENTWTAIATGNGAPLGGALEYTWPAVPDDITTTARIVIRKKNDSTVKDIKNAYFKIRGAVNLDQPSASGLELSIAGTYAIKWTPTGTLGNVKLEYSTNGFLNESETYPVLGPANESAANLAAGASGVQQTFTWGIPNTPSTNVKVRVTNLSDATVYDASNNVLSIIGSLFVDVPNGPGTIWEVGSAQSIQWHKFGAINTINIYYSKDGGTDNYPYTVATDVAAGPEIGSSLSWPGGVPDAIGDDLRIKIVDKDNASVKDFSDASFMIKGKIVVTSPNSTNALTVGSPLTVSWTPTGTVGTVTIQYSTNGFSDESQTTTVASTYQDVSNSYVMPSGVPDAISDTVKFRVRSEQSNASIRGSDVSDFNFPIKGGITLTYPDAANIVFTLGDQPNVTWNATGTIGNVKVEYYNGSGWSTMTTTAPEAGPYALLLDSPNTTVATDAAKVRISDASDATVTDTSANAFMVKPYLAVTSPAGNEAWIVDSSHNITWNYKGSNVTDVDIYYSKNSGSTYDDPISTSTTNDGTHPWTIPDDIQAVKNMKVRIRSLPTNAPYANTALSSGLFQITGSLTMAQPNDVTPVAWRINSTANEIKWNAVGSIVNVKL